MRFKMSELKSALKSNTSEYEHWKVVKDEHGLKKFQSGNLVYFVYQNLGEEQWNFKFDNLETNFKGPEKVGIDSKDVESEFHLFVRETYEKS